MGEKIAPVQGYSAGIPWSLHLRAYDAYCKKYGPQPALIDLDGRGCRGGFGVCELDMFVPGWRDEVSEITKLRAELSRLTSDKESALVWLQQIENHELRDYEDYEAIQHIASRAIRSLKAGEDGQQRPDPQTVAYTLD